jgi:hypothetical protein
MRVSGPNFRYISGSRCTYGPKKRFYNVLGHFGNFEDFEIVLKPISGDFLVFELFWYDFWKKGYFKI